MYQNLTQPLGCWNLTGITGAATTYSSSACGYAIDGIAYLDAANSTAATPTTDAVTGAAITLTANHGRVVLWCVDTSGNTKCIAGPICDMSGGVFDENPTFPDVPSGYCPVAYTVHKGASTVSGTWTFGSSNWNATGMTHTTVNLAGMPPRVPTT